MPGPAPCGRWLLVVALLAAVLCPVGAVGADSSAGKKPRTAAEVKWPKASQKPGKVTFVSRYPTEEAWDPVLKRFRKDVGKAELARLLVVAREFPGKRSAPAVFQTGTPTEPEPAAAPVAPGAATPAPDLLRAIDIVRIPLLTGDKLDTCLGRLRYHLAALEADGFPVAVWEITELPTSESDLTAWANACFAAFRRPPLVMLGWHTVKGKLLPRREGMTQFLRRYAGRCHSIMLTGEELNTQYYAHADGGLALDFLDYWLGLIREVSPRTFVWCRIDEVVFRGNDRNRAWLERLLPVTDGVAYQGAHDPALPKEGLTGQFLQLQLEIRRITAASGTGQAAAPAAPEPLVPVLLGGFRDYRDPKEAAAPPPGAEPEAIAARIRGYEQWLHSRKLCGFIRFVGYLPEAPDRTLVRHSLAMPVPK